MVAVNPDAPPPEPAARGRLPEFGVDVGEVRLYGAWRDEQPGSYLLIAQSLADEFHDTELGAGE
jgi:hypothetical protein